MKNDIIRKLTSLTLMSIMVAGGLTFAIPGALPQAAAESTTSGTLTVSTTEFGGQQILEIQIRDPDIDDVSTAHGLPEVTIGSEDVRMAHASSGVWYAYVADNVASEEPGDGGSPLVGGGTAAPGSSGTIHQLENLKNAPVMLPELSNDGITATGNLFVQLYDFDNADGETLDVTYGSETISVEFADDLTGSASIELDRTYVPAGTLVHVSISDPRLNLDPTGADTWTITVNHDDADTAPNTVLNLDTDATVDLGTDGHGALDIPTQLDLGVDADNADAPITTIKLEETDRNSGVFENADTSEITLKSETDENLDVDIDYASSTATLFVTDTSPTISIASDGSWSPGEKAVVTLNAPNLDKNTKDADNLEITSDPLPIIEIGTPFTAVDLDTSGITNPTVDENGDPVNDADGNPTSHTITTKNTVSKTLKFDEEYTIGADGLSIVFNKTALQSAPFYYVHTSDNVELQNATIADPTNAPDTVNGTALSGVIARADLPDTLQLSMDEGTIDADTIIVFDILSFGGSGDNVANNAIYRHILEETDNGVFTGTIEYILLNQISVAEPDTYDDIESQDSELVIVMVDDDEDAEISYQLDAVRAATATVTPLTTTGEVSFDADRYSTNGDVTVTLVDPDLAGGRYTLVDDGTVRFSESEAALLNFYIDDTPWLDCTTSSNANKTGKYGLPAATTLEESTPGTFIATFALPDQYCAGVSLDPYDDTGTATPVTGKSIKVTYTDFRDETGIGSTWSDSATIQAVTGSISLDRNVYPIPSPTIQDGDLRIDAKPVMVHIEISDADFNTDSDVVNTINTDKVTINITPVSEATSTDISGTELQRELDALEATAEADRTDADTARMGAIPDEKTDARTAIDLAGTFTETDVDTGIFSETVEIPYNVLEEGRNNNPIEQSYILSVTYTDSSDATGQSSDVSDSAIFNIGTATLSVDATEYAIEQKAFVTLVDYDRNYDSDTREMIDLDEVTWEGSAESTLKGSEFDASPPFLRETEANSGIFLTEITIPEFVNDRGDEKVNLGETVSLTYTDHSPAGADRPGTGDRDIETSFTISRTGASLTLDKDVYSWRDRVTITVVAPDFNIDALAIESVGDDGEVNVRSQLDEDESITLTETGPNTGIFQGTVDLGGFEYDVASGITVQPATMLQVANEDGISVTFTYDEDERDLIQSALIRWNVAEVTWTEDSYREGATGTLRVVDPDRNIHPDTPDSIETIVFSDTYRGGIKIALTETEPSSGVFEGEVIFDILHSEGNRLQVSEGDIVTAAYDDRTLPPPDGEGDRLRVTGTTTVGSIVPPLERVEVSNLGVVDALNNPVDSVSVGQQVNIAADLTSAQSRSQDYAYLLQIQNADGVTVHLSWAASSLAGFGGANVSQSWTPDETGSYTATVFVWESLTNPTALSPQNSIDIAVV